MTLGERLKAYRHSEGLSQEQLAEKLNVSRQAITKWENDRGLPDIDNLIAISRMLGVTLDELVMGEERIKDEAVKIRKNNIHFHLIAAVIFFFAAVSWIAAGCYNLDSDTSAVSVLHFFSAAACIVSGSLQLSKYFTLSQQGK